MANNDNQHNQEKSHNSRLLDAERVVYRIFKKFWEIYPNLPKKISGEDMTLVNITRAEIESEIRAKAKKEGYREGLDKCDEIMTKVLGGKK